MTARCTLLALLLAAGCVSEQRGHEQALELRVKGALPQEVQAAQLVVAAAELVPCRTARSQFRGWGTRLAGWLLPTAHAHSSSHALRIGEPTLVPLHDVGTARRSLGRFYAPAGTYCRVDLSLAPADADTQGLTGDAGVGETLEITFHDGRPPLRSNRMLPAPVSLDPPLDVAGAPARRTLRIEIDLGIMRPSTFDDPDLALAVLSVAFQHL